MDRYEKRPQGAKAVQLMDGREYVCLCAHPDIIQRLWFELPRALPENCRDIVYGHPVLRHPRTGLILAFGLGTYYMLWTSSRILEKMQFEKDDFIRVMPVDHKGKKAIDLREVLGQGWIYGRFREVELEWCRAAYGEAAKILGDA